jgi:hypothetical protein
MLCLAPRRNLFVAALMLLAAAGGAMAQQNRPPERVVLQPRFRPGQVMRYHMTLESDSSTDQSGSIRNSEGPVTLDVSWDATIRLEVSAAAAPGSMRLRIVYEISQATVDSDTPDPRSDQIRRRYAQLAGRSLEFTLTPGGQVSDIHGLEDFLPDDKARASAQQWIQQLSATSSVPAGGVVPGQRWTSTQTADLPLDGFSWRTESTYVRNEPCALATAPAAGAAAGPRRADCAVILSRLTLVNSRPMRDPTPDDYRRNNLRTSGRWSGTGQSLMYVSLDTGWVVSNTQESKQEMDVTIADVSPNPAGPVRRSGSVITRSQLSLLAGGAGASAKR